MANILVGISGSIAAYKSVLFIRELTKEGHHCKVILTSGGAKFVTAELIAGLGCEVYTDNLDLTIKSNAMLHINLAKWAEQFIIAPASANLLAKLAHGFADNLLTTIVLAYNHNHSPIYLAPAMNQQMWLNSLTKANLSRLKEHNFIIWEPQQGLQACGDIGPGRMLEAEELLALTLATFDSTQNNQKLNGKTILITLGATIEPIDPVRYISNHSSGKMGAALVKYALSAGATVIAIHGKLNQELMPHPKLTAVMANSAQEMLTATLKHAIDSDLVIGCAAICDYQVKQIAKEKLKKDTGKSTSLELIENPDILKTIKTEFPKLPVIGFAAETQNTIENAYKKLQAKGLDLIVANDVSDGKIFGMNTTQITLIDKKGVKHPFPPSTKNEAAKIIMDHVFASF